MGAGPDLARLTVRDFEPLIGEVFGLAAYESDAAVAGLVLREATGLRQPSAGNRAPFSLLFEGPSHQPVGQGMYFLDNAAIGKLPILVVPVGATANSLSYEAIFN